MANAVRCRSIKTGEYVDVPRNNIIERKCAYAFVLYGRSVLFLDTKSSGKNWLPGGGMKEEETLREALHREVREETGIELRIVRLVHRMEEWLWHEGWREAFHIWSSFYVCIALTDQLVADGGPASKRTETENPHWVPIDEVDLDRLQPTLQELFPRVRDELLQIIEEGV